MFKCHRESNTVYGVNDISFNCKETFATCSSDGSFQFWDKDNKTKTKSFSPGLLPVTCCSFNRASNVFAWAVGYDWYKVKNAFFF